MTTASGMPDPAATLSSAEVQESLQEILSVGTLRQLGFEVTDPPILIATPTADVLCSESVPR